MRHPLGRSLLLPCSLALAMIAAVITAPPAWAQRLFDPQRAYRDLVRQCEFGPRLPGTQAHNECARWLARTLYECADTVELQRFTEQIDGCTLQLTNVIATFNPKGREHVLLCAHWDSRPSADCDPIPANRSKPVPGANDGASGVAVLLEIARALKAQPPEQRVTIALFDGEDYGPTADCMFLGSRHFADSFTQPHITWAVLLDMIGDRDLRIPIEPTSQKSAPKVVERIWAAAGRVSAGAFVRQQGPEILDDHVFLLNKGIPCIVVMDFGYAHWHTTADTPDKCAPESLAQVGRTILAALEGS